MPAVKGAERLRAVGDAAQVFGLTLAAVAAVHWSFGRWQRSTTIWPVGEELAMLAVPLLWLYWRGADPADYGLRMADFRRQLRDTVRCGIPFSAFAALSFVPWGGWSGVVSLAAPIAALLLFAYVLRKPAEAGAMAVGCLLLALPMRGVPAAAGGVAFYLLLLGPAEEVLFRGAIQSRLNLGFGRPFAFGATRWGWGAVITSALFGLMHVVNLYALLEGHWNPNWWAGPVEFCFALPFAYLRERTGGVVAPALLHAWPQAIAFAVRVGRG
jgi:membrane protease YdiL (CAAX protease family)